MLKPANEPEHTGAVIQPNDKWFLAQLNKNARYINGQKFKDWMGIRGSNSQDRPQRVPSNTSGLKIFTEQDIVKLRDQNPTKYQSANTAPASRPNALGGNNTGIMGKAGSDGAL